MLQRARMPASRWLAFAGAVIVVAVAVGVLVRSTTGSRPPALASLTGTRTIGMPAGATVGTRTVIDRITVHHTESGATAGGKRVDAALIGSWHEARHISGGFSGAQAAAYHFVILPDGTVQAGRPLNVAGSGTRNIDDNRRGIGVVLVGDFSSKANKNGERMPDRPTAAQLRALTGLALWAFATFDFGPEQVHGHREVATSDCPGDRFDLDALRTRLSVAQASGERGVRPPIVLVR